MRRRVIGLRRHRHRGHVRRHRDTDGCVLHAYVQHARDRRVNRRRGRVLRGRGPSGRVSHSRDFVRAGRCRLLPLQRDQGRQWPGSSGIRPSVLL